MVTALHSARTRFFDKCGNPLCGGTVHTYQVGTTTAKPTYTDVNKTAVNTNPVILDSIGSAAIFLDGAYRVRVLDRNGVLVEDIAYIESWIAATEKDKIYENITTNKSLIDTHINKLDNPHQVTKAQVGLGNVDNTADLDKPISNAAKAYIDQQDALKADSATTYSKSEVDIKVSAVSGGYIGAYSTLAELQAKTGMTAGQVAKVMTDSDSTKNGDYYYDGTSWIKGYDALTDAKEYARQVSNYQQIIEYSGVKNTDGKLAIDYAASLFYVKIAVAENDKYFVPTQDYSFYKGWYFADANGNVLAESESFREASESIAIAPANSAFLYVNYPMSLKSSFKAQKLSDADIIALRASGIYPKQMSVAYLADTSTPPKAAKVWSTPVFTYIVDVKQGEKYLVDAKVIGTVKSYYFVQPDMTIVASDNNEPTLKILTVPNAATKLIVCSDNTYTVTIKKLDYFDNIVATSNVKKLKDFYPPQPSYRNLIKDKCPKFFDKLHHKNGDLVVVMSGTSLTQGNLYTSHRTDASSRPPLLHTNDLASHIFDTLIRFWHGQKYMRYDHADVRYYDDTEWLVSNDIKVGGVSIWDDRAEFKNGLTKTSVSPNARVSTVVPVGAWQFNFIYRSDSQGANCVINIYEGNGKIEVFDGTNWVEANKYSFSMRESAKTNRKGNTCYQKRLKMRCKNKAIGGIDSLATVKNITISKGADSDRFNVVGFEWSPREFMFTLINGARGSHNWGSGTTHNLENYQDTDIWEFKPDLILCEATTINWGGGWGYNFDPNLYVNYAKRSYYDEFGDNPLALKNTSGNFENCEVVFYGDTLSTHAGATQSWNSDKTAKFGIVTTVAENGDGSTENLGRAKTVFENYEAVEAYMQSKSNIFIPVVYQFKELAEQFYGNYPDAFEASWYNGDTLSLDSVHLNDNGAAFWAYLITPLFANL